MVLLQVEDKRRSLLRFVQEVQPHDVLEHFQRSVPPPVRCTCYQAQFRSYVLYARKQQALAIASTAYQQIPFAQVTEAMRTTVTNLLGTLPPQFFSVTISANVEDLAQIMYSMLMTGYMYRNAQYRIDLEHVRLSYGKMPLPLYFVMYVVQGCTKPM